MKKVLSFLSILILIIATNILYSQNYQTFNSGRISYFEDENHFIKSVRIDSVNFDTDSILVPMGNIQADESPCYSPNGASWHGLKVVVKANGNNLFFNRNSDTVFIKTSALLNEVWIAYQIPGNMIVTAQVLEVDTLSFLGLNDSVKYISFQVYNQDMVPINHLLNTFEIILSKNYGMLKTLNFYQFPDIELCDFECQYLREFYVAGLSNPEVGIKNFTSLDIYDFQPGDELHVVEGYSYQYSWNSYTRKEIFKYLHRYDYGDSIFYDVEITTAFWNYSENETGYSFSVDTIVQKYYLNSFLSCFPDEAYSDGWMMSALAMISDEHLAKVDNTSYGFVFDGESCWSPLMADGFLPYKYYYKGLGGPYYAETWGWGDIGSCNLIYYSISGETWGTPMVLSDVNSEMVQSQISVYPNPANKVIKVDITKVDNNCIIEIYNVIGVKLISKNLSTGQNIIDLGAIPAGVYFYQIKFGIEVLKCEKFVKE